MTASLDFQRRKLAWTLAIMATGLVIALLWQSVCGLFLGLGYPYNTFLFVPGARFSDMTDLMVFVTQPNPYSDPTAVYGPFAWVVLRFFSFLPDLLLLIGFFFISTAFLFLMAVALLEPVCRTPMGCIGASLALFALSYPMLICFDRGNTEIVIVLLLASTVFLISRAQYALAGLCLVLAISLKMFPAVLMVLFLRQRKLGWVVAILPLAVLLTALSLWGLAVTPASAWELYHRNATYLTRTALLGNLMLENSASPWILFKVVLVSAGKWGLIEPVDFSFNGAFITAAYGVYVIVLALIAGLLAIYAAVVEKEFTRAAMVLMLFLSISVPSGGDYQLLMAEVALVMLIVLKTRRAWDFTVLLMLAVVMVPKKEIFFTYLGKTESGFADVSLNTVLNPTLVLGALVLLLWDGWAHFDGRWTAMRLRSLARCLLPRRASRNPVLAHSS